VSACADRVRFLRLDTRVSARVGGVLVTGGPNGWRCSRDGSTATCRHIDTVRAHLHPDAIARTTSTPED